MTLSRELDQFLLWIKQHALPNFAEQSKDLYTEDYQVVYDELCRLGSLMRDSVEKGHKGKFDHYKTEYLKWFEKVNQRIAKQIYADILDDFLDQAPNNLEAEKLALSTAWGDPLLSHWLSAQARMTNPQGEEVFIVANERHIPQGKSFLMLSEVPYLASSGHDPWEFVKNRRAYVKKFSTAS